MKTTKEVWGDVWDACDTLDARWAAATAQLDVRGNTVNTAYDDLGRLAKVWLQDQPMTEPANYEFTYGILKPDYNGSNPSIPLPIAGHVVTTRQLLTTDPTSVYVASYAIVDSLGRTRQTQTRGSLDQTDPEGPVDRIITGASVIDGRGLTLQAWAPYASFGKLGELAPASGRPAGPSTQTTYDALGRTDLSSSVSYYAITPETPGGAVDPPLVTDTDYDGLTTTVNPPGGLSAATSTTLDALGRTRTVVEHQAAVGVDAVTTYGYTLRGEVETITDHGGNVTEYGYDFAGRRVTVRDPNDNANGSTTSIEYDLNGNVVATVDARGQRVWSTYDELNRVRGQGLDGDGEANSRILDYDAGIDQRGRLYVESVFSDGAQLYARNYNFDSRGRLNVTGYRYEATGDASYQSWE